MSAPEPSPSMPEEVVQEFFLDAREIMDKLDRDIVVLEREPDNREILSEIYRCLHTLKGNSAFLGLSRLLAVTHAAEELLSLLRDGALPLTQERTTLLLRTVDAVRRICTSFEKSRTEGDEDSAELVAGLAAAARGESSPAAPDPAADPAEREETRARAPAKETHVRVDVALLDRLMNLVGELVLARNHLLQQSGAADLAKAAQRINLITSDLQDGIMRARLLPLRQLWDRFPRVLRDLALSCGKKARLETAGEETELDRSILEALGDPLTHLLRNAVDHGLESPAQRFSEGKEEEGRILLSASHRGGHVVIEVTDDGRGLDLDRIRAKARESRLLTPEQVAGLDDHEAANLVFLPGFSTAERITEISGRGVGLDVVRANIERVGGTIEILSERRRGSTFRLTIPLTLTIIPALVIANGEERYAIPQASLQELVLLSEREAIAYIEAVHDAPVYRLRGRLLPLVRLDRLLGSPAAPSRSGASIVVLSNGERSFGLLVDRILDTQEIVVKPGGRFVKDVGLFGGATILGDGRVALILDARGVARLAGIAPESTDAPAPSRAAPAEAAPEERESLLLLRSPDGGRMAVPLGAVVRLEEFSWGSVERAAGRLVVQYRGAILPLLPLAAALPERRLPPRAVKWEPPATPEATVQVVVYTANGRSVGLIVDRILDIVDEPVSITRPSSRHGVRQCAVIREKVTELLDVEALVSGLASEAAWTERAGGEV